MFALDHHSPSPIDTGSYLAFSIAIIDIITNMSIHIYIYIYMPSSKLFFCCGIRRWFLNFCNCGGMTIVLDFNFFSFIFLRNYDQKLKVKNSKG